MFKIEHHDIDGDYIKVHFASTKEIADEVVSNLSSRFLGTFETTEAPENICGWDPGGMLMLDDDVFSFPLDNITVECKAQHFDFFMNRLLFYGEPRGETTKYIKIHSEWTCICLTVEEFNQLRRLISNPELAVMAEDSFQKRESKMRNLIDNGHIKRVVKDKDGNIYEDSGSSNGQVNQILN